MKFVLKNCWNECFDLEIDLSKVKYIFRQVISGDEVYTVVYNDNSVKNYDSDTHFRCTDYNEEFSIIYPEEIDLGCCYVEPEQETNFTKHIETKEENK